MFRATKATLTAVVLIVVSAPSVAYARFELNPAPRGVAIVLGQTQNTSSALRSNADRQIAQTGDARTGHGARFAGFTHCPRVGPCVSPDRVITQGSGNHFSSVTTGSSAQAFHWADAGVGAAGMLVILAAGAAAAAAARRQRRRVAYRRGVPAS
jgi:hypothetical protein